MDVSLQTPPELGGTHMKTLWAHYIPFAIDSLFGQPNLIYAYTLENLHIHAPAHAPAARGAKTAYGYDSFIP